MADIVWFDVQYPQLWSKLSCHATITITFMRIFCAPRLLLFPSLWLITLYTDGRGSINRQYDVLVLYALFGFKKFELCSEKSLCLEVLVRRCILWESLYL
jgi:hypothetical protein